MTCTACGGQTPVGARFCPACGARTVTPSRSAERKLVTVVFCDLVGSTALSEALDPEALRSVMLQYFAVLRATIEQCGGTVEKFIGDAVMAVFGVPVMHEDDARRAAAAAVGMLDALARLNADLQHQLGVRLRVRIGVHTGPAVASADVSSRQALVSGDTVNVAARLEQSAGAGEILIGPLTRQALGASARTELVGPLPLRGVAAPLTAYRLLGIGADDPAVLRRFDLPFVGRAQEMAALGRALTDARVSGAVLITVYGEPGIGKTRLVRAWLDRTTQRYAAGAGRCRPYGDSGSLAPLAEVVDQLLATPAGRAVTDAEARGVLSAGLLPDGTPGSSLDGTSAAVASVLRELSQATPVIVTVDDCHWASDTLLEVLRRLVTVLRRSAVLVICLARLDLRDRRPGWDGPQLVLEGLSRAESEVIVATRAEVGAHIAPDAAPVLDAAGGNPFYLEQLLAAAEESAPTGELPHSLQSLLGARIDALDLAERSTLDLAAVLGREFLAADVSALAHGGPEGSPGGPLAHPDAVTAALSELRRRRLVESAGPAAAGDEALRFGNGLIHEVTYRAMAKRTRAERHVRAARLLAGRTGVTARIATHLERAYGYRVALGLRDEATEELRHRAARLLGVAGAQAFARSDLTWAATLLGRAVDLLTPDDAAWAAAARRLGEIRLATGRAQDGAALLRAVLDRCADPVNVAHARLALAVADDGRSFDGAAEVARETLPVFAAAGDHLGQARAYIRLAQQSQRLGRHGVAEGQLRAGLRHAVRGGAEPELALALGAVGVSLWRGPMPVPTAIDECRRRLASHGAARPTVQVTLSCPIAVLLALDDRADEARACLTGAGRLAAELDIPESGVVLPIFRAAVESLSARPRIALDLLDRAAEAAERLGAAGLLGTARREAARLLLDEGRYAEAAEQLATIAADTELLRADRADLDGLRGRLAAEAGAFDEALDLSQRAVAAAGATDSPIVQAVAHLDRAAVLARVGRREDSAAAAVLAGRCFAVKGHRPGQRTVVDFRRRVEGARVAGHMGGTRK
jgi:class 3 adenylate cyclase/Cdc6-like AAA superfamily ATPase